MSSHDAQVLWTEGDWRCEYHAAIAGQGRLEVYKGEVLVTAESTVTGPPSAYRSEVLRQRVLRGDLRADVPREH